MNISNKLKLCASKPARKARNRYMQPKGQCKHDGTQQQSLNNQPQASNLGTFVFFHSRQATEQNTNIAKIYRSQTNAVQHGTSYTLANAIIGVYPDYEIDPSKVLVSRGSLTPAANASAASTGGSIEFSWDDNSGVGSAKQTDKALIAIVNSAKGEAITDTAGAERTAGSQTVVLPADWDGDTVEVYLGFVSEDNREVSNSVYLGAITVA
ncbi:MAG: DUF6266 family protein [Prevotellaceae bacterium]|jgi:hypothetical protein|nr:DUF6266 family protein [Prevotellaceae bacterium]